MQTNHLISSIQQKLTPPMISSAAKMQRAQSNHNLLSTISLLFLLLVAPNTVVAFQQPPITRLAHHTDPKQSVPSSLYSSSSDENKNLSAAGKERRQEEKRRNIRKNEVVPGKTSAIAGEKDFPIDPTSTENAWMQSASREEQEVFRQTEMAMENLRMLRLEEAEAAFNRVFALRPGAYCWQAGIIKYYLGNYVEAAQIFSKSASIYESKFGAIASEERIWRDACELKYLSTLNRKERQGLDVTKEFPQARELELDADSRFETRKVLRIAKDLFEASCKKNDLGTLVLSRAKLRSICGDVTNSNTRLVMDRKMWKINSCFYLGLHYDALGEDEESKKCMKLALRYSASSSGKSQDLIHTLPILHMSKRDWFDDDEFEAIGESDGNTEEQKEAAKKGASLSVESDPLIVESIQDSISKMKLEALKTALKARGLKHSGSKEELQAKLFQSLVEDVGLQL